MLPITFSILDHPELGDFFDNVISFCNLPLQQNHPRDHYQKLLDVMLYFLKANYLVTRDFELFFVFRFRARNLFHILGVLDNFLQMDQETWNLQ